MNARGVRRGVEATTTISRKDFGITSDTGIVGDDVKITIDAEMTLGGSAQ
ncbi:MAG TPA: YceI family protein [Candidatus Acidoferrales bacterium]|nr:YceI family protein [Candidatus Acidoferrales bacterium]